MNSAAPDEVIIIPGVGVSGLFELGWDRSMLRKHVGKGKAKVFRNHECVRFTWHYTEFKDRDIRAYFDRIEDTVAGQPRIVDCIWFGPSSKGRLASGIRIGHSTRAEVYALYGVVRDDPTADYDSLGLSIGFEYKRHTPYSPQDTVDEIYVFPPGSTW